MPFPRRRLLATAAATLAAPSLLFAQDKPVIRILVGFPPGGGTDAIARYIAERLAEQLGQPVIIDNKPGAGGRMAADALMTAPPDGLTYMIAPNATPTFQVLVFGPQLKWNLFRDFEPVAGLVSYPLGMAVHPSLGVSTVPEFVKWAKANPGRAGFGTPGTGGQNHFLGLLFAKVAGIELPLIPYRGTPPLMTDLLGGHLPAAITLMDLMMPQHRAGKARVIGVFTEKRSDLVPDIPTFAEQGFNVTLGEAWTQMWAPVKAPAAETNRVRAALQRVLAQPAVREHLMTRLACVPHYRDGAEMARQQKAELAAWEPVVRGSGFKPD